MQCCCKPADKKKRKTKLNKKGINNWIYICTYTPSKPRLIYYGRALESITQLTAQEKKYTMQYGKKKYLSFTQEDRQRLFLPSTDEERLGIECAGAMVNHCGNGLPNITFQWNRKHRCVMARVVRVIYYGQQLLLDYGQDYENHHFQEEGSRM